MKIGSTFCIMLLTFGVGEDFFSRDYVIPQDQMIPRAIENRSWLINYLNGFHREDYNFKLAAGKLYFSENPQHKQQLYFEGHVPQENLIELLHHYARPSSVAIDASASIGTTTMALCEAVGVRGRVIAFETRPKVFCELFHNLVLNQIKNVRLYWGALAAKNGTMELNPSWSEPGCSKVSTKALDYFRLKNVSLIKVDVDQLNLDFLSGAKKTIEQCRPVIVVDTTGSALPPNLSAVEALGYTLQEPMQGIIVGLPR